MYQKQSLKLFFWKLTAFIGFLLILLLLLIIQVYQNNLAINQLEKLYLNTQKVTLNLRQSSDDLTKYARLYVVTQNKIYFDNFHHILDIRNGIVSRPQKDYNIYWDLNPETRLKRHPDEKVISLSELLEPLLLTDLEKSKLLESEKRSNKLVQIEVQAFNLLKGLSKDEKGEYAIQKKSNQALAIKLLHSKEYLNAKHDIMLPIDEFLELVEQRLQSQKKSIRVEVKNSLTALIIIFSLLAAALVYLVLCVKLKVLKPITKLHAMIKQFKLTDEVIIRPDFDSNEIGFVAESAHRMMVLIKSNAKALQKMAYSDSLTQIHNRKYFFTVAKKMLQVAERTRASHVIMMLDIDHFKEINDNYGHLVGDKVLLNTSKLIERVIRKGDLLARFGGEEFIVLLPNSQLQDAANLAEVIREKIASNTIISVKNKISITMSIGVSHCQLKRSLKENIQAADKALYLAKAKGRNRVELDRQSQIHQDESPDEVIKRVDFESKG